MDRGKGKTVTEMEGGRKRDEAERKVEEGTATGKGGYDPLDNSLMLAGL